MALSAAVRQRSARSAARTRPPNTPASTSIARLLLPSCRRSQRAVSDFHRVYMVSQPSTIFEMLTHPLQ